MARRIKDDPMIRAEMKREKEIRLEARSIWEEKASISRLAVSNWAVRYLTRCSSSSLSRRISSSAR